MKTTVLFALTGALLAVLLLLCGCDTGREEQQNAENVGLANPIKEVAGPADFETLGVCIDAPESATEAGYSTISDKVAQVRFKMSGRTYTYRAAKTDEDISGVYEKFDELEQSTEVDADGWAVSIIVKTVAGGEKGALASWSLDDTLYTLYTGDVVDADAMSMLSVKLVESAIASTAG